MLYYFVLLNQVSLVSLFRYLFSSAALSFDFPCCVHHVDVSLVQSHFQHFHSLMQIARSYKVLTIDMQILNGKF